MATFDSGWYNQGENTQYPFDQLATLADDSGRPLPTAILADLSITLPQRLGERIFCSGISKTDGRASIVFSGSADGYPLVATATLLESDSRRRAKLLEPAASQVQGSFVPGSLFWSLPNDNWRFSTPAQSLIGARSIQLIYSTQKQDVRLIYGPSPLAKVIRINGEVDIAAKVALRSIAGVPTRSLVFALSDAASSSTLRNYSGKYQQRPESRTCGSPEPIETINLVQPDCCGRVYIELRGCARPVPIDNYCGVVLDCPVESDNMCASKSIVPDETITDHCQVLGSPDPVDPPADSPKIPKWWSRNQ